MSILLYLYIKDMNNLKSVVKYYLTEKYYGDYANLNFFDFIDTDKSADQYSESDKIKCALSDLDILINSNVKSKEYLINVKEIIENTPYNELDQIYKDFINATFNYYYLNQKIKSLSINEEKEDDEDISDDEYDKLKKKIAQYKLQKAKIKRLGDEKQELSQLRDVYYKEKEIALDTIIKMLKGEKRGRDSNQSRAFKDISAIYEIVNYYKK